MSSMIAEICAYIHNYFEKNPATGQRMVYSGRYTIENGSITLPFIVEGQYFRIIGSRFNDGVYLYPATELKDETFDGVIWEMRPPKEFLGIVAEIEDWMDKYGEALRNPYQSEEVIGVYSYSKMTTGKVTGDYIATWQNAYKHTLNQWRRLS